MHVKTNQYANRLWTDGRYRIEVTECEEREADGASRLAAKRPRGGTILTSRIKDRPSILRPLLDGHRCYVANGAFLLRR